MQQQWKQWQGRQPEQQQPSLAAAEAALALAAIVTYGIANVKVLVQFWFSFAWLSLVQNGSDVVHVWFGLAYGAVVVQVWCTLVWPHGIWFSIGTAVVQLCMAWLYMVQVWVIRGAVVAGPALYDMMLHGSIVAQLW